MAELTCIHGTPHCTQLHTGALRPSDLPQPFFGRVQNVRARALLPALTTSDAAALPYGLEQGDPGSYGDVQALNVAPHWNRHQPVATLAHQPTQPRALRPDDQRRW